MAPTSLSVRSFTAPLESNEPYLSAALDMVSKLVERVESTGVGALLLTDWKNNLGEMFVPGKEVLAYRTPEECAELIRYYLTHDEERQAVARAGQARTLRDHTYYQRMQELVGIVGKLLS